MARATDDILVGILGNQLLELAKRQAKIEAMAEEVAALKAKDEPPKPSTPKP